MSAVTDQNGFYSIANVPPGEYAAAFYYGDASGAQSPVHVIADRATSLFGRIQVPAAKGWGPHNVPYCRDVDDRYVGPCFP